MAVTSLALSLTGCRFTAVKDEPVTLTGVRDAVVVSGGSEHAAVEGARLGKGDTVRTGSAGAATLVVRGRKVRLGAATTVKVPDGATLSLAHGSLLVDRRHGPGLTVIATDTTVDDFGSGAVRIERTFVTLVAGLSAGARVRTATGPRLGLPELFQATVSGRALPRTAAPLHLRDDDWERSVISDVVDDDIRLNDLARGVANGEALLAKAIGRAAGNDDATRAAMTARAQGLRDAGGSWGVVARLVKTNAVDTATALADELHVGVPTAGPSSPVPGSSGGPSQPGPTPTPGGSGGPTSRPTPSRTPPPTTEPTSGSPSASPDIVQTIQSALPTHVPFL